MKQVLLICFSFFATHLLAQSDNARKIEPDQQTSFENFELLVVAVLGLLLLIGLRFWFKRTRKH